MQWGRVRCNSIERGAPWVSSGIARGLLARQVSRCSVVVWHAALTYMYNVAI